ncbi:MAG: 1-acyl-sn-glycerol-3-phosphate acyltransferase [Bacteroidetes bacterium]|nr:1-acyl-sn-glycerol-3-phosphate acyltransferase [Bacteroidota bacterium]MCL2301840.1 1-acyl-sn-glycerol-3-phosphate acyltransferase [Lentimicrobiaceae bacterium]
MKKISLLVLKILNYKIDLAQIPKEKKYVLVFAPHTSWTDFVIGKMALTAMGVKTTFLIKKEFFFFPLGSYLKYIGGYPVDRKRAQKMTDILAEYIKERDEIAFLITPEGTRRCAETWKRGFYFIAQKAEVPIALAYLDYHDRKGGIGPVFYPTGNYNADLQKIQRFYCGMRGKRMGCFNLESKI